MERKTPTQTLQNKLGRLEELLDTPQHHCYVGCHESGVTIDGSGIRGTTIDLLIEYLQLCKQMVRN